MRGPLAGLRPEACERVGETGRKGTASSLVFGGAFTPRRAQCRGRQISGALLPHRLGIRLLTARYTGGFGTLPLANRLVHIAARSQT